MAGVSNTKTPFVFTTEDELSMLIDGAASVNAKNQISYAVIRMKIFASSAGVPRIETINETELDRFWPNFTPG